MANIFNSRLGLLPRVPARHKPHLNECYFYHAYELSDGSILAGPDPYFDLRGRFADYIGNYPLNGKTVFDFGTASGFLSFEAEKAGARVTAFDTASFYYQDRVPYNGDSFHADKIKWAYETDRGFNKMHNSFWFMWHEFHSAVEMCYGCNEDLVVTREQFDVVIAGAVLEHVGDPVTTLGLLARLTREALIIAFTPVWLTEDEYMKPLVPWDNRGVSYVWWALSKGLYTRLLNNLGFSVAYIPVSADRVDGSVRTSIPRYTILATRT